MSNEAWAVFLFHRDDWPWEEVFSNKVFPHPWWSLALLRGAWRVPLGQHFGGQSLWLTLTLPGQWVSTGHLLGAKPSIREGMDTVRHQTYLQETGPKG